MIVYSKHLISTYKALSIIMSKDEDYEDDDELTPQESGFLKGYRDAQKKQKSVSNDSFFEEEFEDEKMEEE